MLGEKFQQAHTALKYVLQHLQTVERFNIIAFSTGLRRYAEGLQPAANAPHPATTAAATPTIAPDMRLPIR